MTLPIRFHPVLLLVAVVIVLSAVSAAWPESVTTIRITDRVLVADAMRLGINLGGDAYYSGAALVKRRARENFEGAMYRVCHFGPGSDERGVATWFRPSDDWQQLITGGKYTILSGPSKWTTGTVRGVVEKPYKHEGRMKPFNYFLLDKPIRPPADSTRIGIMIERDRTGDGQVDQWETKEG